MDKDTVYSVGAKDHFYAVVIKNILSLSALGRNEDHYLSEFHDRVVSLISCLIAPQSVKCEYTLKIIATPVPAAYTHGNVRIAIFGRLEGGSHEQARSYSCDTLRLLRSLLPEYELELLSNERIKTIFDIGDPGYRYSIVRRYANESLDTLRINRKTLGFDQVKNPDDDARIFNDDKVFHVYPYITAPRYLHNLFSLMLRHDHAISINCYFVPTELTEAEVTFLERQIVICERYSQVSLGAAHGDMSELWPTLRERAHLLQERCTGFLHGLMGTPALATVEIHSDYPVPPNVISAIGTYLASSDMILSHSFESFTNQRLAGGYRVIDITNDAKLSESRGCLRLPVLPNLPAGAERLPFLFDAQQLSAVFKLPPTGIEPPPGMASKHWKCRVAPANLCKEGILAGISPVTEITQDIRIGREDRFRHVYIVGQTGTGKSTLLKTMAEDDMKRGEGLCVVDPHGDLFTDLLGMVPEHRIDDVVVIDPTDMEFPVGLNLLDYRDETQIHFVIQELSDIVVRMVEDQYGDGSSTQMIGPMFLQHLKMNLLLAMSDPSNPTTLVEYVSMYKSKDFWRRWLPLKCDNPQLAQWVDVMEKHNYLTVGSDGGSWGGYLGSKLEGFVFDPMLRNIFGQKKSAVDFRDIMDTGKILLVNLAKGEMTEANSRFFGMVLLAKLQAAAMGRSSMPRPERRDFHIYVDEFQNIATQNFIYLLSEARKFRVSLTLANQYMSQLRNRRIMESVLGNVGTLISFRVGQNDAELLEHHMGGAFSRTDLINLPNWYAAVSTMIDGQTVPPFTIETLKNWGASSAEKASRVRERARKRYARPRKRVEKEVLASLGPTRNLESEANTEKEAVE